MRTPRQLLALNTAAILLLLSTLGAALLTGISDIHVILPPTIVLALLIATTIWIVKTYDP